MDELIKTMQQVDRNAPSLEPNQFNLNKNPIEREMSHYGMLVVARHTKQCNCYMDNLALQVSNAVMRASDLPEALTKFIRNIEARVFADMQSAVVWL